MPIELPIVLPIELPIALPIVLPIVLPMAIAYWPLLFRCGITAPCYSEWGCRAIPIELPIGRIAPIGWGGTWVVGGVISCTPIITFHLVVRKEC